MFKTLVIFLLFAFGLQAQIRKNYDIESLNADIQINPYQKKVFGTLEYRINILNNTDSILFDAPKIFTKKVKTSCFNNKFRQTEQHLIIRKKFTKNKTYKIKIWYEAKPPKAMYFTGWQSGGRKQVWTQGQGKDNSHWLPSNSDQNDKFTWQLNIKFPKPYSVISNGVFTEKKSINDTINQFSFIQNKLAPAYLIFVGTGKYNENKTVSNSGIPIYNYQYPDRLNNDKTYYQSKEIFDFLEQEIGKAYPWDNYKQIPCRDFLYGGMENVSATSFNGDRYVVDNIDFNDVNFVNVSAHELAHQWFGDLVTGKSSDDHWLHEGFATYYARLNDIRVFSKNYNDYETYKYDRLIIRSQATDTIPLHRPNATSLTYYQKGARVVQMLRQKIDDKNYGKLIQRFLTKYALKNATISDFQQTLFEITGDSLPVFFKTWFEDYRIPKFVIKQQNDSLIFLENSHQLPVKFTIVYPEKIDTILTGTNFKLEQFKDIKTVIVNPDNRNLYDINFERPKSWIKQQIINAPDFIDRYIALTQIRNWSFQEKDCIFKHLVKSRQYYPVYQEIIKQIKNNLNDYHILLIRKLFEKDVKTRQQIALQLDSIPPDLKMSYRSLLSDSSYVTRQAALWRYWTHFPNERHLILNQTSNYKGGNDKAFRLTWLSLALMTENYQNIAKPGFIKEIISYSSPKYNMLIRLNAFEMLMSLQIITDEVIRNMFEASLHFNWRMHKPARNYLQRLYLNKNYRALIQNELVNLPENKREFFKELLKPKR